MHTLFFFQMARNEVVKRMWEIVKERKLEVQIVICYSLSLVKSAGKG